MSDIPPVPQAPPPPPAPAPVAPPAPAPAPVVAVSPPKPKVNPAISQGPTKKEPAKPAPEQVEPPKQVNEDGHVVGEILSQEQISAYILKQRLSN